MRHFPRGPDARLAGGLGCATDKEPARQRWMRRIVLEQRIDPPLSAGEAADLRGEFLFSRTRRDLDGKADGQPSASKRLREAGMSTSWCWATSYSEGWAS